MSGLFGIISLDLSPIDNLLLEKMGTWMEYRGPDAKQIWTGEFVALGNTFLNTSKYPISKSQIINWKDTVWITSSARIDDRDNLLQKLNLKSENIITDAQLILEAYLRWEEDCLQHIIGDFSFAIYDNRNESLFCGRDHFGIEQFYYTIISNQLIFSNCLGCLLLSPKTPREVDNITIGDFILFGVSQSHDRTFYKSIKKLPPGHILNISRRNKEQSITPFWSLEKKDEIIYRNPSDYIENFKFLLRSAVIDRIQSPKISISLSGGLDGPAIAAICKTVSVSNAKSAPIFHAFTSTYQKEFDKEESRLAKQTADFLEIPIDFLVTKISEPFPDWDMDPLLLPNPYFAGPFRSKPNSRYQKMGNFSPVILTGMGADTILGVSSGHFGRLIYNRKIGPLLSDSYSYWSLFKKFPNFYVNTDQIRVLIAGKQIRHPFITWLNSSFVNEFNLRDRWEYFCSPPNMHNTPHDMAHWELSSTYWPAIPLALNDSQGLAIESRHPFFDIRLINFVLAIPPYLCNDKMILREVVKGILPERVRTRKKTSLGVDPFKLYVQNNTRKWIESLLSDRIIEKYIDKEKLYFEFARFQNLDPKKSKWIGKPLRRALSLSWWLQRKPR